MLFKRLFPSPDKKFDPEPCPGCPLRGSRKVGARGTVDSPLVIILEAPGAEELKYGAPICGPSGDLLDKSVPPEFDFDDAYIINAMQCRPPKGSDPQKDKAYKAKACAACRARVLWQIFNHPRKAVLALGNWSNSSLTQDYDYKITQRRGEIYHITSPTGDEVSVIPSVHPAYLLRGSGNLNAFKDDVRMAIDIAFSRQMTVRQKDWEDPQNAVLSDLDNLEWLYDELAKAGDVPVTADIETGGFDWRPGGDEILCIGFYCPRLDDTGWIVPGECLADPAYHALLKSIFALPNVHWIWQFGKFDEKFLRREGLIADSILDEDTGLLSYALSEATKDHDLDEQAKNVLGAPNHKSEIKKWVPNKKSSYRNIPRPNLYDYTAKDVKKTHLLWEHNRPLVAANAPLEKLYTRTLLPFSKTLAEIEQKGIAVDWNYVRINRSGATQADVDSGLVKSLDEERGLENELIDIETKLGELVGYHVNPNSPDAVAELLYDRYRLTIKNKRPQNTRKETLAKLPLHPAVKLILQYRSTTKMLSTYVGAIEKMARNGRIHTTFKQHITPTGRLSSSEPNIQNIPRNKKYKRMYCAGPGMKIVEGDYNSAELRMLAVLSQDEFLMGVFLDDKRNLHDEVSVAMYGPNWTDDQRIRAKAINFGIPYGRDAYSIAIEFDITPGEAQRLIDAWFGQAPQAAAFLRAQREAARSGGTLVTVFGRKRRAGVVSPERVDGLENEFCNFHMQSPISDFTGHAAMEMLPKLKKEGAHIVNLVHDSTLTEYPDDSVEREQQVCGIIKETMEGVPKKWIVTPIIFKVDIKVGTHWGMAKKWSPSAV